tara:strand:- start:2650 stop:3954 length:1305 start_codon:yes stop_codon:yes gene_type:complete
MSNLYVYTLFDQKTGRPRCTGIKDGARVQICDLYRPGAGKTIKKIDTFKKIIKNIFLKANAEQRKIILSDFKSHIKAFDLLYNHKIWNVYDVHLLDVKSSDSSDHEIVARVLDHLSQATPKEYQKVLAQAATVYQDLENTGLLINHDPVFPKWSQKTFSGRSKTTGFNIQGFHEDWHVVPQGGQECDVMIHFDWVCADIRIASILSQDNILNDTFLNSDPYTILMNQLNSGSDEKISREESKRYLLKSINSMDFTSVALTEVYPRLGRWIRRCKETIVEGRPLKTILGRKFRLKQSKNELAVLNGVMQGSVAHAMHLVLRRIWDKLPSRLITEIHDCLVVSAAPDSTEIKAVIDIIAPIMLHPFEGILDSNPAFPFNISIGKKWKKWKLYETHREFEVISVARQRKKEARDSEEGCREGSKEEIETAEETAEEQ